MFEIRYHFSNNNSSAVEDADATALRYSLFLGSLSFKNGDRSLTFEWDWIPLLDFALCLFDIHNELVHAKKLEKEFEFTESDEKIIFTRDGNRVKITSSSSGEVLEMSFDEFQKAVKKFYKEIIFDIL